MKYKVNDNVVVEVEIPKKGHKRIVVKEPAEDSHIIEKTFPIVRVQEDLGIYTIIIDDDIIGWSISQFHINYYGVNKKYLGKKFYDIVEYRILKKK